MLRWLDRGGLALWVFAISCARANGESVPGGELRADSMRPHVGDRVVVEQATAAFVEGIVNSIEREQVRIEVQPSGRVIEQPLSEVYVPGRRPKTPPVAPGNFAVCHMPDGRWRGCRVDGFDNERVRVVDDDAASSEVRWEELLVPTAVTELNVRQRFERSAKRRAFREGARSAIVPRVPSGWRPRVDEKIVARREGEWLPAQIKELRKSGARIHWDDDRRQAEVSWSDIAPQPPVEFAPTIGTYVLAHPIAGPKPWTVMRVESAGQFTMTVSDELGETYQLAPRDVLPLDRGTGTP
jgi:hypothetical protein